MLFVVFLSNGLYLADDDKTTSNQISRLTGKSSQAFRHQQGRCMAVGDDTPGKNLAAKAVASRVVYQVRLFETRLG